MYLALYDITQSHLNHLLTNKVSDFHTHMSHKARFKSKRKCELQCCFSNAMTIQVFLVICGVICVVLFWTANTEFTDKKTHFDWKFGPF